MQTISLKNLSLSYTKNEPVLKNISLDIQESEIIAILGFSGSGKSSLLRAMAGLQMIDKGTIKILNQVANDNEHFVAPKNRSIGFLFQDYALFPHLTVKENILFANKKANVGDLLSICRITGLEKRYPHKLSGGQQQRAAVARILALQPKIFLLDEPFSSIDFFLKKNMQSELLKIIQKLKITTVFVTHDIQEAISMADRILVLKDGEIEQCDSPYNLYHYPKTEFIAKFIGDFNIISPKNSVLFGLNGKLAIPKNKVFLTREKTNIRVCITGKRFFGNFYEFEFNINDDILFSSCPCKDDEFDLQEKLYIKVHPKDLLLLED